MIWSKTELKCTLKKFHIIIHENNKSKVLSSHYSRTKERRCRVRSWEGKQKQLSSVYVRWPPNANDFVSKNYFICFYYDKSQLQNLWQTYPMDILKWKFARVEILFCWLITRSILWEKTLKVKILHRFILIQIQQLVNITSSYFLFYSYIN